MGNSESGLSEECRGDPYECEGASCLAGGRAYPSCASSEDEGTLERRGRVTLCPRKSKDPKAIHIALGSECCAEASLTSLLFLLDLNQGPSD